jgi:hypothetical protein
MDDKDRVKELLEMIDMWTGANKKYPYLDTRRQSNGKYRVVRVYGGRRHPEVLGKDLTSREADAFMKMLGEE